MIPFKVHENTVGENIKYTGIEFMIVEEIPALARQQKELVSKVRKEISDYFINNN